MDKTGICQAVVPVSGLLALTARTLRQSEFVALEKLAGVDAAELAKAMLSVDRFVREDSAFPVDAATRAALLDRFGMFGLRISIAVLRTGVSDSVALADELLERSGLVALRDVIDQQFAQRSDLLKAHTALLSLRQFVQDNPIYATPYIIADIDPLLADTHAFEELRLLSQLRSRANDIERRRDGVAAPDHRRLGHRRRQQAGPAARRCRTTGRARRSPRRSGGAAAPTIRSTTRSPRGRAGPRCAAPRRMVADTPPAAADRLSGYPPGSGICGI